MQMRKKKIGRLNMEPPEYRHPVVQNIQRSALSDNYDIHS